MKRMSDVKQSHSPAGATACAGERGLRTVPPRSGAADPAAAPRTPCGAVATREAACPRVEQTQRGRWQAGTNGHTGPTTIGAANPNGGNAGWDIALGLLKGRDMKITQFEEVPRPVTNDNLSHLLQPGWTLQEGLGIAPGPPGRFFPRAHLHQFVTHAAKQGWSMHRTRHPHLRR